VHASPVERALAVSNYDKNLSVLVLSAQKEHVETVVKALKKLEINTIQVMDNGIEALQKMSVQKFGFLICDQNIRYIKGWLLIKEIKAAETIANIPVILFGKDDPPDSEEVLKRYGIVQYLKFPVTPSNLDFMIHSTLTLFNTSGTVENKYTKAKDSLLNKRSEEAIELYSELRSLTKNSVRSSLGLAQAYLQDDKVEKANQVMEDLAKNDEDSPAKTIMQAKVHLQKGEKVKALALIQKVLEQMPDGFYFSRCVRILMDFQLFYEAAPICEQALKADIKRPEFYLCLSKDSYARQDFQGALKHISLNEKEFGMTSELFNLRGVCYKKLGNFERALDAYEQALRLEPTDARVYFNLAMCSIGMRRVDDAAAYLQRCLKYSPNFPKAREKLDEILRRASA
jgi:Flp pilus assembly protein TadD